MEIQVYIKKNNTMLSTFISRAQIDTSYISTVFMVFTIYILFALMRSYRFSILCKHTASDRNIKTVYHFPKLLSFRLA